MKYFTIEELTKSAKAKRLSIDNTPTEDIKANLKSLVEKVLDPLREAYGKPIVVNSGYRCPKLNKAVGGVSNSQHVTGEAADIRTQLNKRNDNKKLFDLVIKLGLHFDQLIDEHNYSWIHISYSNKGCNRGQTLHIK